MRNMSGGKCYHYDCTNRNCFGYCKTTACINFHYQHEQWECPSTTNTTEKVVLKSQMTDYTELVKTLRETACRQECGLCPKINEKCIHRAARKAADIIEELTTSQ